MTVFPRERTRPLLVELEEGEEDVGDTVAAFFDEDGLFVIFFFTPKVLVLFLMSK